MLFNQSPELIQLYSDQQFSNVAVRVDQTSGKTIWAKAFIIADQLNPWTISDFKVIDDWAWVTIQLLNNNKLSYYALWYSSFGGFIKFDANGHIVLSKVFANSLDGGTVQLKYLSQGYIYNTDNAHIIFNGKIIYGLSSIGYSNDSYIDQIIFSMDYDGSMNWISVFNYRY